MWQRVLQGAPASLSVTLADQDGNPVAATGTLTVAVSAGDGTEVLAAGTATAPGAEAGDYTVSLTGVQTALLTLFTAVWTDGAGRTVISQHEVVGGYYFGLAEMRKSNNGLLQDSGRYPDSMLLEARRAVEDEAEDICDVAFVPRYHRVTLDGAGTADLVLPHNRIRVVRSIRTYPIPGAPAYVALTSAQLAGIQPGDDGRIRRTDYGIFDDGTNNILVEYEHGYDSPPAQVHDAALIRLRSRLNYTSSGVSDRTTSFTSENGQTFRMSTAGTYSTGIPEVDAAYGKYSYRAHGRADGTGQQVPASASWNLDPQRYSVFHGGVR